MHQGTNEHDMVIVENRGDTDGTDRGYTDKQDPR